jgi:hypothetical protein
MEKLPGGNKVWKDPVHKIRPLHPLQRRGGMVWFPGEFEKTPVKKTPGTKLGK